MKAKSMMQMGACAFAAGLLLSGCAAPVKVKDVQANPLAYLGQHFAPDQLPGQVRKTISDVDAGPLGFQRMVLHMTWTINEDDKNKTMKLEQTQTLINAGGSLVESLFENSRNGVPTGQLYALSYRGLVWLSSQSMNLAANIAPLERQVRNFKHFDTVAASPGTSQLDYEFSYGTSVQLMNFPDGRTTCVRGNSYPASQVFASLAGEAQDMECSNYNSNGVLRDKFRYAYLQHYGVAISTHSELASGISDAKVDSVTIQ